MFEQTFDLMPLWAFALACGVTLLGGFVKGAVGFAMPLVMISGLSMFLEPLVALAGVIFPIALSNLVQVMRFSWAQARDALLEFWRYILMVCVMIIVAAQFVTAIPASTFFLVLGVPTVVLSMIQLVGVKFQIAPAWRHPSEWGGFCLRGYWRVDGHMGAPHRALFDCVEHAKGQTDAGARRGVRAGLDQSFGGTPSIWGVEHGDGAVVGRAFDPGISGDAAGVLDV
jgi:uncharacterized protein